MFPSSVVASGLENAFLALLQQSHVGIAQTDATGRFVRVNKRWADMLGYTEKELLQLGFSEVMHPESSLAPIDRFTELADDLAAPTNLILEKRYVRKNGSSFWASATISVLRAPDGGVQGFIAVLVDLSQQRRQRQLVESQNEALQLLISGAELSEVFERLVTAVEADHDGASCILLLDETGTRFRTGAAPSLPAAFNRAIEEIPVQAGVGTCADAAARNEMVVTPDLALAPSWDRYRHLPLDLGFRATWSLPIVSSHGKVLGAFCTYFRQSREPSEGDVNTVRVLAKIAALAIERRVSEESLRQANANTRRIERLYEVALTNTPDLIFVFNRDHRFTYANKALLDLWGRTWDEAIGRTWLELGYERWQAEMHDREIEEVVAARRPIRGEVAFNALEGRRIYDYIFSPVLNAHGEVEAISGAMRDVTERRRVETMARFLADLTQELSHITDAQEIIRHAVTAVGQFVGAHRCCFVECLESENLVRVSENWIRDDAPTLAGTLGLYDFGGKDWWNAFSAGSFAIEDTHRHPLIRGEAVANYDAVGVRSYAAHPIKRSNKWVVMLAVTEDQPRSWTQEELRLVEDVGARSWPLVERARSEAALRVARDEALAASGAKDDFLAALSHELRTPLNPVLLLASEAAANKQLSAEVRADFETIVRNVTLEKRLIDDLLDLTGITKNKIVLDLAPQDIHALIERALESVQVDIRQKKIDLVTRLDAPFTIVEGDGMRLQQIFWNLLKNAAKFTPTGGTITVETRRSPTDAGVIQVIVSDTGLGLTAAEQQRVFERFSQGDHASAGISKPFGGLGLGLAISRQLAEMHAGSIEVFSAGRNQGASFTVELPLYATMKTVIPGRTSSPEASPLRTSMIRRVLVIEDHEPSRLALARLLTNRKIEVVHAATFSEALEKAEREAVDLVISDIGLPDGNGYDLMKILQTRFGVRGIALSGYGSDADIERSQKAGFFAHLTKPVRIQALDAILQGTPASGVQ